MIVRRALIVLALSLGSLGCQQDPYLNSYLESLRAEKLWLEDQYYALESEFDINAEHLANARAENNTLRTRLGLHVEPIDNGPRLAHPSPGERGSEHESPTIELGTPLDPNAPDRASLPIGNGLAMPVSYDLPQYDNLPNSVEPQDAPPEPIDRRVTHIVLNPSHTSGYDFDSKIGDDGLAVLIEPRNADNQFISEPGHVSLVILDPALRGANPHVARWEIDISEAEQRMRRNARHGRGIYLRLPWPNGRPKHSKLQLFVRYVTATGEKLQADAELQIALPGQLSHRWTPKSSQFNEPRSDVAPSQYISNETAESPRTLATAQQDVTVNPVAGTWRAGSERNQTPVENRVQSAAPSNRPAPSRPRWSPYR